MATTAARMQQRRRTDAQWTSENPTLAAGELGFASDTGAFKIGDGSTLWNALEVANIRTDFTIVAASDAPASVKAKADVVCDGTDDNDEIETALAAGNVQLTRGTFNVDPMIDITTSNRWLRGAGPLTVIYCVDRDKALGPENFGVINIQGTSGSEYQHIWISDLTVDGNKAGQTGTAPGHPMDYGEGIEIDFADDTRIFRVTLRNIVADGIDWDDADRSIVHDIRADNCGGFGTHLATNSRYHNLSNLVLTNCSQNDLRAFFDSGTANNIVTNVVCDGTGFDAASLGGTDNTVSNVYCRGGIIRAGGTRLSVTNATVDSLSTAGLNGGVGLNVGAAAVDHTYTNLVTRNTVDPPIINTGAANTILMACRFDQNPTDSGTNTRMVAVQSPSGWTDK